jgi:hypothetical protein
MTSAPIFPGHDLRQLVILQLGVTHENDEQRRVRACVVMLISGFAARAPASGPNRPSYQIEQAEGLAIRSIIV